MRSTTTYKSQCLMLMGKSWSTANVPHSGDGIAIDTITDPPRFSTGGDQIATAITEGYRLKGT
jgi:hypothetical protein